MTHAPRRFSDRQRVALFLAANGHCSSCGVPLSAGWHADHITPHSRGGATDVVNGQALCPTCNLKKGDRMFSDRQWARDFVMKRRQLGQRVFSLEACPGAGKTRAAQLAAIHDLESGEIARIVFVVPSANLRKQVAKAFADQAGLSLNPRFKAADGAIGRDYVGVVVTYAAIAEAPQFYLRLASEARTLVVLDEIHHAADERSWGRALLTAFGSAHRILAMSGTPFRTDGNPIPFIEPNEKGISKADFRYGYDRALLDGVCSPVSFPSADGQFEWIGRGGVNLRATFQDEISDDQANQRLKVALDMKGEWMKTTLRRANARIDEIRAGSDGVEPIEDAAGLVTCRSIEHAEEVAAFLAKVTGTRPAIVHSKMPDAEDDLEGFKRGHDRWLVSVRMVSEGVDIPRLRVGVYATNIITMMYMRQFVGRFVRGKGEAVVFIPADAVLLDYAARITEEVEYALREQARSIVDDVLPETSEPSQIGLFQFLGASFSEHVTIRNGSEIPADVLIAARKLVELKRGRAMESVATLLAEIMVEQGWYQGAQVAAPSEPSADIQQAAFEIEEDLRHRRQQFVNLFCRELAWVSGIDPKGGDIRKVVNTKLMVLFGVPAAKADIDMLKRQVRLLSQWLMGIERARSVGNDVEWASAWDGGLYDDGYRAQA